MAEDKKDVKSEPEHITLKVLGSEGTTVQFKIKRTTQLKKLMHTYCEKQGFGYNAIRFRYEGNPIGPEDTPLILDMDDGDLIEVFQQQTGGTYIYC